MCQSEVENPEREYDYDRQEDDTQDEGEVVQESRYSHLKLLKMGRDYLGEMCQQNDKDLKVALYQ
jgi:hypothetical protein